MAPRRTESGVTNRQRLLLASTSLLYAGPFLAGLIGNSWRVLGLFTVIFALWSLSLRPHLWPATLRESLGAEALVALAALIVAQALLALSGYVLGCAASSLLHHRFSLSPLLPLALSFAAVPLSKLFQPASGTPPTPRFDPDLHRKSSPSKVIPPEDQALAHLIQICTLPPQVDDALLQAQLESLPPDVDTQLMRRCFEDAVARGKLTLAGQKALIIHATDPDVAALLSGSGYSALAFRVAEPEPGLLDLFARRCALVLEDDPSLAPDFPPPASVARAARTAAPETAVALHRLAGLLQPGQVSPDPKP